MSDRLVTVCSECFRASCWHGERVCEARSEGTGFLKVSAAQARSLITRDSKPTGIRRYRR